jgi:hypothetical protein
MNNRLEALKVEFKDVVTECERFCYAARARELQVEAIDRLETLKTKASALKAVMVAAQNEDSANQLLSIEEMLQALICELKMWVAFKDDDPNNAWDFLINAQGAAHTAMQAHEIASHLDDYIEKLHILEHLLFPPQVFMSPGVIIKESTCSICGSEYGECDHVVGRPYMGEICAKAIEKFEIHETSVVPHPANKHCRMIMISDGKMVRDLMTGRLTPANSGDISDMLANWQ